MKCEQVNVDSLCSDRERHSDTERERERILHARVMRLERRKGEGEEEEEEEEEAPPLQQPHHSWNTSGCICCCPLQNLCHASTVTNTDAFTTIPLNWHGKNPLYMPVIPFSAKVIFAQCIQER